MSRQGRVWLFDLDNTLHNASSRHLPQINRLMREYIERNSGLMNTGKSVTVRHWSRYGATLLDRCATTILDPHHFLWATHLPLDLKRMLDFQIPIRHMLRTTGKKDHIFKCPAPLR